MTDLTAVVVLEAVVDAITFASDDGAFTVARAHVAGERAATTLTGPLLGVHPGESLRMRGRWGTHAKFGRRFEVDSFVPVLPATIDGIRRYLASGLVKGIGSTYAKRIVDTFGAETLKVIDTEPHRLVEVPGMGPKRREKIIAAWARQQAVQEVMVFLQSVQVSTTLAARIHKQYGAEAVSLIKARPYTLVTDMRGVGFKTADAIARAVGIPVDSDERIVAGLHLTLEEATESGHCYLPAPDLVDTAAQTLQLDPARVARALPALIASDAAQLEELTGRDGQPVRAVYLTSLQYAEIGAANAVRRLLQAPVDALARCAHLDWPSTLRELAARHGVRLAPEQEQAVQLALTQKVAVLTGGPGCGKSHTVRSIVEVALAHDARVVLAAPTGRAAQRLTELTGQPASTVHRLLQLRPGGEPVFDQSNPLPLDLLVVDEASMLDVVIANRLLKAVPSGAHVLLVGDVDQLPSVGPGEVLRELLDSPLVPQVRLTRVFRQAAESGIVANAHRINQGRPLQWENLGDFFVFFGTDTTKPADFADLVVDLAATRIPTKFGLNARDVQVLSPIRRGPLGTAELNEKLQQRITPPMAGQPACHAGGRVFRIGDKVTQLRNDYAKGVAGVFNGTLAVVTGIDPEEQVLTVLTDEGESVDYDFDELADLAHAYAMTIHRSQGSEFPAVVIPVTTSSWVMLQRNLLYTGVTRGKRLVVLVGTLRALRRAVEHVQTGGRRTALTWRLDDDAP